MTTTTTTTRVRIVPSTTREDVLLELIFEENGDDDDDDDDGRDNGGGCDEGDDDVVVCDLGCGGIRGDGDGGAGEENTTAGGWGAGTAAAIARTFGPYLRVSTKPEGAQTSSSSGRRMPLAEVDVLLSPPAPHPDDVGGVAAGGVVVDGGGGGGRRRRRSRMIAEVVVNTPQRFNVTCRIDGGDILVSGGGDNKIEGDVRLYTSRGGRITVESKIRGHVVELDTIGGWGGATTTTTAMEDDERHDDYDDDEGGASPSTSSYSTTTGTGGTIHVKKAIEAKTLTIRSSSRVRARMLNVGSRLSVVASSPSPSSSSPSSRAKLDEDDEGAAIDIGSVYVVSSGNGGGGFGDGEARLVVNGVHRPVSDGGGRDDGGRDDDDGDDDDGEGRRNPGLVRVKSSHGHIVVRAKTYRTSAFTPPSSSSVAEAVSETGGTSSPPSSMPLVDLGGVNGSCDVLLEGWAACSPSEDDDDDDANRDRGSWTTAIPATMTMRVHFDSMSPESISTITSRGVRASEGRAMGSDFDWGGHGGAERHPRRSPSMTSITMDRKLETEVRLLSVVSRAPSSARRDDVDAHALTSDEVPDIRRALMGALHGSDDNDVGANGDKDVTATAVMTLVLGDEYKNCDGQRERRLPISIDTDAYVDGEYDGLDDASPASDFGDDATGRASVRRTPISPGSAVVHYMRGTMRNRSGEPDARSDVRGRGKINVDGAASQALHGFQRGGKQSSSSSPSSSSPTSHAPHTTLPPLLAVATDGIIVLESLSWFGSIARRYGLEEGESKKDVGRQASRLPRLEK
jgi:hypothetical protein